VGPKLKGQMLRTFSTSVRELRGQDVLDATMVRARPEIADGLRLGAIMSNGWYPVAWFAELHKTVGEVTGEGAELSRAIGREATRQDFKGVYRFFAMILSPESIMARANRVYRMFWNTGEVHVLEARRGYTKLHFDNCVGYDPRLWAQMMGAVEMLGEVGGGTNTTMRVLRGGGEETELLIEATWQ
jgi:hypothetical protein